MRLLRLITSRPSTENLMKAAGYFLEQVLMRSFVGVRGSSSIRKANLRIVDLRLAPRDASGLVEFSTDFVLVRPVRAVESTWLYDIANRGGGVTEGLNYVIDPAKNPPSIDTGFLQRNGFTVLTSAWEWDVTPEEGDASALVFKPPVASNHGHRITGKWRTNLPWRSLAIPPPSWALMGAHIPWLWPMIRQAY